jgi:hypothetical protein
VKFICTETLLIAILTPPVRRVGIGHWAFGPAAILYENPLADVMGVIAAKRSIFSLIRIEASDGNAGA